MSRRFIVLGSLGGAVAIHLVFVACGAIGGGGDASAQNMGTLLTGMCDQTATHQVTTGGSPTTTSIAIRTMYADIAAPGLDPRAAPHVTAVVCDSVSSPGYPYAACPAGSTCTDTGFVPPAGACDVAGVRLDVGRVLVYCGNGSTSTTTPPDGGTVTTQGQPQHYQHVFVRVN